MYADRHSRPGRINPASLGIAIAVNVAIVGALLLSNPNVTRHLPEPPIKLINIFDPPPPEPVTPPEPAQARPLPAQPHIETVIPIVPVPPADQGIVVPPQPPVLVDPGQGAGSGGGLGTIAVDPPRPLPPVLVQPGIDPRYADLFQPPYPPAEQRAGRGGRVMVRVLIGVDGRVKEVQQMSATSDDFFRVTQQRALSKWRFTPATRDGIPVEAWRIMTVTFVLQD